MKRKLLLALGLCIVGVAMIGGTSVFFATRGHTSGKIATEGVEISITETTEGGLKPFEDIVGAMPGESFEKVTEVWGVGGDEAWVRAKIQETGVLADGTTLAMIDALVADIDPARWLDPGDGYYYYVEALSKGQKTTPLMTTVKVREELGDEHQGAKVDVHLEVQAVQAAQNGNNVLEAQGWPGMPEEGGIAVPNTEGLPQIAEIGVVVSIGAGFIVTMFVMALVLTKGFVVDKAVVGRMAPKAAKGTVVKKSAKKSVVKNTTSKKKRKY